MSRNGAAVVQLVPHVGSLRIKHLKVLRVVVSFVAIDMMDDLSRQQRTPDLPCGDGAMRAARAVLDVAGRVLGFVGATTRDRAEATAAATDFGDLRIERVAALRACHVDHHFARSRVARLRTPAALARRGASFALIHTLIIAWFSPYCLKAELPLFATETAV